MKLIDYIKKKLERNNQIMTSGSHTHTPPNYLNNDPAIGSHIHCINYEREAWRPPAFAFMTVSNLSTEFVIEEEEDEYLPTAEELGEQFEYELDIVLKQKQQKEATKSERQLLF